MGQSIKRVHKPQVYQKGYLWSLVVAMVLPPWASAQRTMSSAEASRRASLALSISSSKG